MAVINDKSKRVLLELESNSALHEALLFVLTNSFFQKKAVNWKPVKCELVINTKLTEDYKKIKEEYPKEVYDFEDSFGFLIDSDRRVSKICQYGYPSIDNNSKAIESISLTKHTDIALRYFESKTTPDQLMAKMVIFKVFKCKNDILSTDYASNLHIQNHSIVPLNDNIEVQFKCSQIYLYESYSKNTSNKQSINCLPYAVITWLKFNDDTEWPHSFIGKDGVTNLLIDDTLKAALEIEDNYIQTQLKNLLGTNTIHTISTELSNSHNKLIRNETDETYSIQMITNVKQNKNHLNKVKKTTQLTRNTYLSCNQASLPYYTRPLRVLNNIASIQTTEISQIDQQMAHQITPPIKILGNLTHNFNAQQILTVEQIQDLVNTVNHHAQQIDGFNIYQTEPIHKTKLNTNNQHSILKQQNQAYMSSVHNQINQTNAAYSGQPTYLPYDSRNFNTYMQVNTLNQPFYASSIFEQQNNMLDTTIESQAPVTMLEIYQQHELMQIQLEQHLQLQHQWQLLLQQRQQQLDKQFNSLPLTSIDFSRLQSQVSATIDQQLTSSAGNQITDYEASNTEPRIFNSRHHPYSR